MKHPEIPFRLLIAIVFLAVLAAAVTVPSWKDLPGCSGEGTAYALVVLKEPNVLFRKISAYPMGGVLRDLAVDTARKRLYITNSEYNYVLIFSLETLQFTQSLRVGSAPWGIDMTKDSTKLVVCNSGGENLTILDLTKEPPATLGAIAIKSDSRGSGNNFPHKIAMTSNNKGLLSVTNNTSGASWGGGELRELSLRRMKTRGVNVRVSSHEMYIGCSFDRSWVIIGEGDNSGGGVALYSATEDGYSKDRSTEIFLSDVAANADGTKFIAQGKTVTKILNRSLEMTGSIKADGSLSGLAFNPVKKNEAYRGNTSQGSIEVLNAAESLISAVIPLPPDVKVHRIKADDGGNRLYCLTDKGLLIVELNQAGPVQQGFRKKESPSAGQGADQFPAPEKLGRIKSQKALWTVRNLTGYALTLQYDVGGRNQVTRSIPYGSTVDLEITPGQYFISAKVDSPTVRPFSGRQFFEGGWQYGSIFYIVPAGQ